MAFKTSGAISGAASGAATGTMIMPGWGTAIGVGLGMLAGGFGGGGGETPKQGYDVVKMPQYSFSEPNLRLTSDFLSDTISRLGRGEFPAYYDKARPKIRAGMADPLYKTYYGRPGERTGLIQQAAEVGALTGTGPKATYAQVNKQTKDYQEKERQIDQYMASLESNMMNQASTAFPQMAMNMPRGPETAIVNMMGGNSQGGQGAMPSALNLASSVPWEKFANFGSKFSAPPGYQAPSVPYYGGSPTYMPASIPTPAGVGQYPPGVRR